MRWFTKPALIMLAVVLIVLPANNQTLAHETVTSKVTEMMQSLERVFIEPATSNLLAWVEQQVTAGSRSLMNLELVQMAQCQDSLTFSKSCLFDNYKKQYILKLKIVVPTMHVLVALCVSPAILPIIAYFPPVHISYWPLIFTLSAISGFLVVTADTAFDIFKRSINWNYYLGLDGADERIMAGKKEIHIRQLFYQLVHEYLSAPAMHLHQHSSAKERYTIQQVFPVLKELKFTLFSDQVKSVSEAEITLHPGYVFKVFTSDHPDPVLQYAVRYSSRGASILLFNYPYSYMLDIDTDIATAVLLLLNLAQADKVEVFSAQLPPSIMRSLP